MTLSFEEQLVVDVARAKSNKAKINRAVTWLDKKKLDARRGIEIRKEQKRLMELFEL